MKRRRFVIPFVLGLAVIGLAAYAWLGGSSWRVARATDLSPEDTVSTYLSLMSKGHLTQLVNLVIEGTDVGLDPDDRASGMTLEEAEAQGIAKPLNDAAAKRVALEILARQREFVLAEFGEKAWAEASFSLQSAKLPPFRSAWIDRATNKEIDEETALKMFDSFWEEVEATEGINPNEVIGMRNRVPSGMTAEQSRELRIKAERLFSEYEDRIPVINEAVPTADGYVVSFTFGDGVSKTGVLDFTAVLSNRSGDWRVSSFQWQLPPKPPEGDI
jgi:hypothetical protein